MASPARGGTWRLRGAASPPVLERRAVPRPAGAGDGREPVPALPPTASPAEWEREGDYFLERGHFRQAAECFRRAGRADKEAEALALATEEREDWAGALALWTGLRRADRQAPLLDRLGRLGRGRRPLPRGRQEADARLCELRLLEARKPWKEAAAAWEDLGRHADAARCLGARRMRRNASARLTARAAEEAGDPGKAGEFWMEAGDFEAAARCFRARASR